MSSMPETADNDSTESPAVGGCCHCCGDSDLHAFYEAVDIPVNSCVLFETRREAVEFPKGDLQLGYCRRCGFVQNTSFDPELVDYTLPYEETQGFSPLFRTFAARLAASLVDRHDLHDRQILEIGCGKGEFLETLCELGPNRGVGIDPSHVAKRKRSETAERVEFIKDFYSVEYAHLTADLICSRHTLEHIQPVAEFLELMKTSMARRPDAVLFLEVPDVSRVLKECAFWDIYYEHCSYFSARSLRHLLRAGGFQVIEIRTDFDDQYLLAEARIAPAGTPQELDDDAHETERDVATFERRYRETLNTWRERLDGLQARGKRAVIWGAGSKGVSFLTTLGIADEIAFAVDINPYKQGKFLPGTGHEVVSPDALKTFDPDLIVIMNPVYRGEIQKAIDDLGVAAEILAV